MMSVIGVSFIRLCVIILSVIMQCDAMLGVSVLSVIIGRSVGGGSGRIRLGFDDQLLDRGREGEVGEGVNLGKLADTFTLKLFFKCCHF